MNLGYFICDQLPSDFDSLLAENKLNFIIDDPVADRDEDNEIYYQFVYNTDILDETCLLDTLRFYGFINVVLDRDRDSF